MAEQGERPEAFEVDEDPLREFILKAYHERRDTGQTDREVLEAMRQFLSGPLAGVSVPDQYFFEIQPESSVWRFVGALESSVKGLPAMVFEPLLAAHQGKDKLSGNVTVFVGSVAGPVAVRSGLDETLACGLVAASLLAVARLGREEIHTALEKTAKLTGEGGL